MSYGVPFDDDVMVMFAGIVSGFFYVANGLLDLALDLLCGAIYLSTCVAGPLTNLPLRATGCIVNRTFYLVFVHRSTSVD